ncbi:unnamed protein product [Toxocara canis]|uniref:HMG box domain-containing protein n=1 Tax=Toxocara canis TaxID=6265 RepID=A0A183U9N1_TOXCA|nr:unnamed protein product [Toxocara canis]
MAKAKKASGSGGKKAKDPNAPKRAMSAFFFWMQENRERLKKPGMGVADVAKAAGVEWAKLADKSVSYLRFSTVAVVEDLLFFVQ